MSPLAWIAIAATVAVVTSQVAALWIRRRTRTPMTAEDHLRAARVATRALRRENSRIKADDPLHAPLHISDSAASSGG